ncbi:cytochrome c [Caulobacter sp. 1776]|uniref:c-type cytochrome n=1 Tax=Caulobacter sp. 1776 TaxID=3156420 RepID=UPI00339A8F39
MQKRSRPLHFRGRTSLAAGAVVILGLQGCAILGATSPAEHARQRQVEIGRAFARTQCAACHQMNGVGAADEPPPFTEIARRYEEARLDWELETIAQVGHYRMPRKPLSAAEITALTAYIRSLDAPASETPGRARPRGGHD